LLSTTALTLPRLPERTAAKKVEALNVEPEEDAAFCVRLCRALLHVPVVWLDVPPWASALLVWL
jgi:hypothetical protein